MDSKTKSQISQKQKGQKMSYVSARSEMQRKGWENPTNEMINAYSYLGNHTFFTLIEKADVFADFVVDYFEKRTERRIVGTPLYRGIHLSYRKDFCRDVIKNGKGGLEIYVPDLDEKEVRKMLENISFHFDGKDINKIIAQFEQWIMNHEGGNAEFGGNL